MKLAFLKPRVSEKGYALSEQRNTYIFDVPKEFNRFEVAKAVAEQYEVTVVSTRLANVTGKPKRSLRGGGRSQRRVQRSDIRKAYVTLKDGDKLPFFDSAKEADSDKETK